MKRPSDDTGWPRRLQDSSAGVGPIMRKYVRRLEADDDDEPAAFARAEAALRPRTGRRWMIATGALAIPGVVALWLTISAHQRQPGPPDAIPAPAPAIAGAAAPDQTGQPHDAPAVSQPRSAPARSASARSIRLGPRAVALPSGRTELHDEATVLLAESARAVARSERGNAAITLDAGRIDLRVRPRPSGRSFAVTVRPFNFVVVGTTFSVTRRQGSVTLQVTEGRVAVVRGTETLASVTAGESWTGRADDVSTACADLAAAGRTPDAIACLERRAAHGTGPDSDVAAYEAARLWKDAAGDLERARLAFQSYRTRFPQGALRVEAAMSLVEILPRLGRHQEALAEATRLLDDPAAAPRRTEIHLVRGNILRLALGDPTAAAAEYRAAAAGGGKAGDEGAYLHAVCLDELGRRVEARQAFAAYLSRPEARRTAEAMRRKEALSR